MSQSREDVGADRGRAQQRGQIQENDRGRSYIRGQGREGEEGGGGARSISMIRQFPLER